MSGTGIEELVNSISQSQMKLQPGLVLQAMVLDVLSGRSPLYHLESFLSEQDTELLLGEIVDVHDFNDTNLAWTITENQKDIDRVREIAGSFVILTSIPKTGSDSLDCEGVIRTYKGQYSIDGDFAFLKDPLIVNDLFTKTPSRIVAPRMILIIALMIYRLMQRTMIQYLQKNNTKVLGWDKKPTDKPTAYMFSRIIIGIQVICFRKSRIFLKEPDKRKWLLF